MTTKISVIVPILNGMPYLEKAVDSVVRQTYADWELLLIDGGSTDGTVDYLVSLTDPRIRVLYNVPGRHVGAVNIGLNEAKGEWVALLDADDIALPQRFEQEVLIAERMNVSAVGSFAYRIGPSGKRYGKIRQPVTESEDIYHYLHKETNCILNPSALMNREHAIKIGGYREEFWPVHDYELWIRLSENYNIVNIPMYLAEVRVHLGSITSKTMVAMRDRSRYARRCAEHRLAKRPQIDFSEFMHKQSKRPIWKRLIDSAQNVGSAHIRLSASHYCSDHLVRGAAHFIVGSLLRPIRSMQTLRKLV